MKFYMCQTCGNLVGIVKESGAQIICCGEPMKELIPGTSDGAYDKHVPVITKEDNKVIVNVGSVEHPMMEAHFIEWIALETKKGAQRKVLHPNEKPQAVFMLTADDEVIAAYAYCNLHGLWKSE